MCLNGQTITMRKFCDGVQDCDDGSDEIVTSLEGHNSLEPLIE